MSAAVVADTHALIWYLRAPSTLSPVALAALRQAVGAGEAIFVSAISLVEIVYLTEKNRIPQGAKTDLDAALQDADSGIVVVSLDTAVAREMERIPRDTVPDMPDRIIAATALHLGLPLVTRDSQIRAAAPITTIW